MTNRKEIEATNQRLSAAITAGIVGVLILFLFIVGFSLPKIDEEPEGLLVDFGTDLTGFGLYEPASSSVSGGAQAYQPDEQEAITQDIEESITVTDKKVITKPKVNPVNTTTTTTKTNTDTKIDPNQIYTPGKTNTKGDKGTSEGDGPPGGNKGDPNGDPNGDPSGNGSGTEYSLKGRKPVSPANLSVSHNEIGDIKIKIYVDRNGKVTKAEYERSGSTITDSYLISQAKSAAIKATFNADQAATETQIGYITFHFKLN